MVTDLYILYEYNNITSLVWHAKMEVYIRSYLAHVLQELIYSSNVHFSLSFL